MSTPGIDSDLLLARDYDPVQYLLAPWLAKESLAILWAWRGVGKSWVALSIAHACASAGRFLGWHAPTAYKVCLIDGELGGRYLSERLRKVVSSAYTDLVGSNLRVITFEDAPNQVIWNLASPEGQAVYSEIVKDYDLIIVDNIATTVRPAGRGFSTEIEQWAMVQSWAIAQRSKGKSILFVDHAGKAGHQRGTSTKEDVMDTIISLTRDSEYDASFGCEFNWKFEKSRHFYGESAQSLRVTLRDGDDGNLFWSSRSLKDHIEEKVRYLLRKKRAVTVIQQAINVSRMRIEEIKELMTYEEEQNGFYANGEPEDRF